jgi:hypothetical protein
MWYEIELKVGILEDLRTVFPRFFAYVVEKSGAIVQGLGREILNLKTRVRFPIALPKILPKKSYSVHKNN